jgi:hypothetical protein
VSSTGGHSGDHQAGFDLAIVPVIKIICRSRPSSWSWSSVAHSRRNHQGLVADGAPPRNALPVDEASAAIQPNRVTIAIRNEALPEGKIRNTTKSALAAIETTRIGRQYGSPRTARAIVSAASTPVAMINRNAIPWIQPCHVSVFPPLSIGVSTLKAASISATPRVPNGGLVWFQVSQTDGRRRDPAECANQPPPGKRCERQLAPATKQHYPAVAPAGR